MSVFENIDVAPCQVFVLHDGLSFHQLSFLELLNLLLTTKILNYLKELLTQNQVFSFDLKILFFHIQATELSKSWSVDSTALNSYFTILTLFHSKNRWRTFFAQLQFSTEVFRWVWFLFSSILLEFWQEGVLFEPCASNRFCWSKFEFSCEHLSCLSHFSLQWSNPSLLQE